MPRPHRLAGVLTAVLLLAACTSEAPGAPPQPTTAAGAPAVEGDPGAPATPLAGGQPQNTPAPGPAAAAAQPDANDPQTPPAGAQPAPPAPVPADTPPPIAPVQTDGAIGSACRQLLQPSIPRLVIEVDVQAGVELPAGVTEHLRGTIAAVADKPAGVEVIDGGGLPGSGQDWTLEDLRALAASTRDVPQTTDAAVIHLLSVAGQPSPDDERIAQAIGIAFNATEFVVFAERIDGLATLLGTADDILRSVVIHELGHLLCLVNIQMTSTIDHEDPEHPGHSRNSGSVMFHAVETTAVGQLFSGPPPDTFDADDLADLAALRSGAA